jgi:4-hydroxy-2-oxoglutarate aldolase
MSQRLTGIFPPIATPFNSDGELMIDWFHENVERLATTPLTGFVVAGSNGESASLADDEKLLMLKGARARIGRDRTLVIGVSKESTLLSMRFIRKAADAGADMALVGTPCYFKTRMDDDALFAHFWMIADESPMPIMIYNVPQFTGVHCSANLIEKLSAHENIAGIKESSGNIAFQAEVRRRVPERFKVVVGSAATMLMSFVAGACGGVVAIANVLPNESIEVYETFRSGDWEKAARLQDRLAPVAAAVTTGFGVPGLKYAMDLAGYKGGAPRLPLLPLNEKQKVAVASMFRDSGYLGACSA